MTIEVPAWIQGIDAEALNDPSHEDHADQIATVRSIREHGCESQVYLPAVTHSDAVQTMNEHGDEILDCLDEAEKDGQEVLHILSLSGWHTLACLLVSSAVELWAAGVMDEIEEVTE